MINDPISFENYEVYLNGLGFYDSFDIKQQYKLYLATQTGDEETIRKEMVNYYYNTFFFAIGKLN